MTEELKQEAEEKLLQAELDYCHELSNPCEPSELPYSELLRFETGYKRGYLASAEPREKRIAELEYKLNNLSKVAEVRLANWQKYEKENAELKAQIEKLKLCQNCKFEDNDFIEEPCSACTRCLGDIKRKGNSDKWELQVD